MAEPIVIGPPQQPTVHVGSVAIDAPFVADPADHPRPVILLSHGFGGTAELMGWFGTAMAEAGYIVISVDHPGNNAMDRMTVPGAILWWERAEDLKRALEAISHDQTVGPTLIGRVSALPASQREALRRSCFAGPAPTRSTCNAFAMNILMMASVAPRWNSL